MASERWFHWMATIRFVLWRVLAIMLKSWNHTHFCFHLTGKTNITWVSILHQGFSNRSQDTSCFRSAVDNAHKTVFLPLAVTSVTTSDNSIQTQWTRSVHSLTCLRKNTHDIRITIFTVALGTDNRNYVAQTFLYLVDWVCSFVRHAFGFEINDSKAPFLDIPTVLGNLF